MGCRILITFWRGNSLIQDWKSVKIAICIALSLCIEDNTTGWFWWQQRFWFYFEILLNGHTLIIDNILDPLRIPKTPDLWSCCKIFTHFEYSKLWKNLITVPLQPLINIDVGQNNGQPIGTVVHITTLASSSPAAVQQLCFLPCSLTLWTLSHWVTSLTLCTCHDWCSPHLGWETWKTVKQQQKM